MNKILLFSLGMLTLYSLYKLNQNTYENQVLSEFANFQSKFNKNYSNNEKIFR